MLLSEMSAFRVEWRTFNEAKSTATVNAVGHGCLTQPGDTRHENYVFTACFICIF